MRQNIWSAAADLCALICLAVGFWLVWLATP